MPNPVETPETRPEGRYGPLLASIVARRGVLTALAILAGLWGVSQATWQVYKPQVASQPRYQITPESIRVTAAPGWVQGDVVADAMRASADPVALSSLDSPADVQQRLAGVLAGHPWVRRVGKVSIQPPNRVFAEVEYRRPLATVLLSDGMAIVDVDGVRLPDSAVSPAVRGRLPRIGVALGEGRRAPYRGPLKSRPWPQQAIAGAAQIIDAFGDAWPQLHLYEVHIVPPGADSAESPVYSYRLRSTGNTIVRWGAAPGEAAADEDKFEEKLARLCDFVTKHGRLDSVKYSPAQIDVRSGIEATRRVVLRSGKRLAAKSEKEAPVVK